MGDEDCELSGTEARLVLAPLVRSLKEQDSEILELRFFEGLTQQEIGDRIGVSQMQVSRLLARILAQLRRGLGGTRITLRRAAGRGEPIAMVGNSGVERGYGSAEQPSRVFPRARPSHRVTFSSVPERLFQPPEDG